MVLTRIATPDLATAIEAASQKITEAFAILEPYMVVLTDADRSATPRPREGFPKAARSLSRAMADHPKLAAVVEFDPEAVSEDLDNVAALAPFWEKLTELTQRVADSRLTWLAEAYLPCLAVYAVAKVGARTNGALRTAISPLARIFASARSRSKEEPTPEE